ncbi:MAG TPA: hypothetical protein VD996_13715 [Chitinophagaceae bacterium]|nr:hypothetical protein [Chitinophagaceae bacterium]
MSRSIFYSALLLLCVLVIGCRKDSVQEQAPVVQAGMERLFHFNDDNSKDKWLAVVGSGQVKASSFIDLDGSLAFAFSGTESGGKDYVRFNIKRSDLVKGVANYPIKSSNGNLVEVTYTYTLPQGKNIYFPGMSRGWLRVTGYNERFNTIDGRLDIEIWAGSDPRVGPLAPRRETYISVICDFRGLAVPRPE